MIISEKWKKIIFIAAIVVMIELTGYGFLASLLRLLKSIN